MSQHSLSPVMAGTESLGSARTKVIPLLLPGSARWLWHVQQPLNVRGLFIMLFEMKCSKHNLSRLQESKEHCAPIPMPGAVSALEMHTSTGAPGNGASLWGPGTVNFAAGSVGFKSSQAHTRLQTAATYSFEGRRASQCSPAGSGKDGLCPLQHALLRAWQR